MSTLVPCVSIGTPNVPGGVPTTSGGSSGGVKGGTTPVSQSPQYMRKKKFSMENATCLSQLSVENLTPLFNYLETGNTAGTITLEIGNSMLTYPQDRIDFVEEMLEGICNGDEILNPENLDDQITTTLPPCLDSLVNDLKSLQNGKFGKIIKKFAGNNPVPLSYNWAINSASLDSTIIANTHPLIQGGVATSTINSDFTSISTNLSIAKTLIHEAFHAYLVSVYRYRDIDFNYANMINQYSSTFNKNPNDIHHHLFTTNNIVMEISAALKEYGIYMGYNFPQQFYDDMAWGGLYGTQAYNALSTSQKERIESTIESEFTNSNNSPNNTLGINPRGVQICP